MSQFQFLLMVASFVLFFSVHIGQCALPAGFITVVKGSAQLSGADRSTAVVAGQTVRVELKDTVLTSDGVEAIFHLFDGSSFTPDSRTTYSIQPEGIYGQENNRWNILHGFLVLLSSSQINTTVPRGRQPVAKWASNGPLNMDGISVSSTEVVTSGELSNGQLMKTGSGTIVKVNGGKRGTVLLSANSDLRLLPQGYGLTLGGGMFHLGPDSRHWLYTPYFDISAIDSFFEVLSDSGVQTVKVLRGRIQLVTKPEDSSEKKSNSQSRRFTLRSGQSITSATYIPVKSGNSSVLNSVAKDFISRMNETGLDGFSEQFIQSLSGGNQMSQVVAVEGPSLPPTGAGRALSSPTGVPYSDLPRSTAARALPSGSKVPAPPPRSDEPIKVPVGVEKSANSALNPLNKTIPGENQSDWYSEN